jgi:hypothetical protein
VRLWALWRSELELEERHGAQGAPPPFPQAFPRSVAVFLAPPRLVTSRPDNAGDVSLEEAQAVDWQRWFFSPARKWNAAFALADLLSRRGLERLARHLSHGLERRRTSPLRPWPERKLASLVRCVECRCISEDARDWIAKLIDDDEESESSVVLYCPDCAEWEFERQPRSPYT